MEEQEKLELNELIDSTIDELSEVIGMYSTNIVLCEDIEDYEGARINLTKLDDVFNISIEKFSSIFAGTDVPIVEELWRLRKNIDNHVRNR